MNDNLKILESWCNDNKLTVNSKKTKFVLFDKPKAPNLNAKLTPQIYGKKLEGMDKYNYLGVILDNTLTFRPHIEKIIASCTPPPPSILASKDEEICYL